MDSKHSIETQDISKQFQDAAALKKINICIENGEIFGLLGPSGAGKTTLIKILTGQIKQTSGEARILGTDTTKLTNSIYTKMGMVLDNVGLYDRLSCYDNLILFTQIYGIPKKNIFDVLEKVGLSDAIKRPVSKLSKGMKQRLVLARAIMHKPKILFLDEPTSGLDPSTANEIHKLIYNQKEKGTTVFLTTHNMEEASKLCDNVALLHCGNIVEYGNPQDVCRKYNHQNKIRILLKNGQEVILENDGTTAGQIGSFFAGNLVESIHSTEPNLETVFMELTGRRFE